VQDTSLATFDMSIGNTSYCNIIDVHITNTYSANEVGQRCGRIDLCLLAWRERSR
jgi:hypothetical protein